MISNRKRMRKIRGKRMRSIKNQIEKHKDKIKTEKGRKDTTKDFWQKEIDEKFLKQLEKDRDFLNKKDK